MDEKANDTTASRGLSTDQHTSIESMIINKKRLEYPQNETRLVRLSIQESAIGTQIEAAERRAEHQCSMHDENNIFWKRVNALIKQQSNVASNFNECSDSLLSVGDAMTGNPEVIEFMNQP